MPVFGERRGLARRSQIQPLHASAHTLLKKTLQGRNKRDTLSRGELLAYLFDRHRIFPARRRKVRSSDLLHGSGVQNDNSRRHLNEREFVEELMEADAGKIC